jgi:hypothetical protein
MAEDFYSPGGYTREQEAYLQSLRDAFNDLAGRYPGAALIMPDFMNPSYNQPSEDPNVEVDTWTPHYAPGSEIDKAMASGLTPEQMISNLGYGVVNYGDVKTGGTRTGTPGVGYQYLTPGQTYTLIDNVTGKQMGPSASTPEELRALSDLANFTSNSSGNKANWSIVTGYGTDAQKPVASDVKDPDKNLDWLYILPAIAAAAIGAPYLLGGLSSLGGAAGAAGAGAAGAAGGTAAGSVLGALAPFAGETAISTALAPTLASTLVPAAVAGGALGAGLSSLPGGSAAPSTTAQPSLSPGVEEVLSTAPADVSLDVAPVLTGGLSTLPVETITATETAPSGVPTGADAAVGGGLTTIGTSTLPVETTTSTGFASGEPTTDVDAALGGGLTAAGTSTLPVETITSTGTTPSDTLAGTDAALGGGLAAGTSTLPAETVTSTGSTPGEPSLDLDVDAGLGAAGVAATTSPGSTPATPTPSSTNYLNYIRTALGLASLLGGGSGSSGAGAGTGTMPGGAGTMPESFKTGKLPTGPDIPPFGGGTSPSDRAPRDVSDIDWKRYGFGPERSFFMNVPQRFAAGGSMAARPASKQAFAVKGPGDGRSDDIPAVLSDGEYVMDAETVALLGNGSNKAGAAKLDQFRANVRKHKGKELAKGRFSVNAKKPQAYMAGGRS